MATEKGKPGIGTPSPPRLHVSSEKFRKFKAQTFYRMEDWTPEEQQPHGLHIRIGRSRMQKILYVIGDAIGSGAGECELEFWGEVMED